jgi:hypothetical protein
MNEPPSYRQLKKWLRIFLDRSFPKSQFKRSAFPNAPVSGLEVLCHREVIIVRHAK